MIRIVSGIVSLSLVTVFLSPQLIAEEPPAAESILEDTWQVALIKGQRVGYAHTLTWETGEGDHRRIWSESRMQMKLSRFGVSLTMAVTQVTTEDDAGNLKSFKLDTDNPPVSHTVVSGEVRGDMLHLTTTAAGRTSESTQPWDTDVKSPVYQDRLLQDDPVEAGEARTLRVFDPQFLQAGDVTLTGMKPETTTLLDGSERLLDKTQIVNSLVPGMVMTMYQDRDGEALKTESNLLGMVFYTVSREEAVREIAGPQLDLALDTLVRVEPISEAHGRKTIIYKVSVESPQHIRPLPETVTQSVTRLDDQSLRVTLRPIDLSASQPAASTETVEDIYRGSSRYLECEHPQVAAHAEAAAAGLTSPTEIALAMEKYVHQKLTSKNFSTAMGTAAEVATSLEGDCTEHAILLAAMLRVKDIPSRVAVGLVYSERHSAFVGHMWTEAFLEGRWVPLDATLGQGGIGAGHLKFSDSSLSDDAPSPVTAFVPLVGMLEKLSIKVVTTGEK